MGLNPDLPDEIKPIWDIVMNSLQGLINEDFKMHTENFSKDFVTNWGDGGGTEGHIQMLGHFFRGGGLEGIGLNLSLLVLNQIQKAVSLNFPLTPLFLGDRLELKQLCGICFSREAGWECYQIRSFPRLI